MTPPSDLFESGQYLFQSNEYRYDALGRRVLVQSRRQTGWRSRWVPYVRRAFVRRTVWDGSREVDEAQAPLTPAARERTDTLPEQPVLTVADYAPGTSVDLNPHVGQVGYGYVGDGVDQPATVERFRYADRNVVLFPYSVAALWTAPAFTISPSWNAQGSADLGTVRDGGRQFCQGGPLHTEPAVVGILDALRGEPAADGRVVRVAAGGQAGPERAVVSAASVSGQPGGAVHAGRPDRAGGGAQRVQLCGWGSGQLR